MNLTKKIQLKDKISTMSEKLVRKTWEENTWTKHASNIIDGLGKFPTQSNIIIILRHSQRYEPKLVNENDLKEANMELTPLGREVAENFGLFANIHSNG